MRQLAGVERRGVDDVVVGRVVEGDLELVEHLVQDVPRSSTPGFWMFSKWLEWVLGRIQVSNGNRLAKGQKAVKWGVSSTIRFSVGELLLDHVAVDAAAAVVEELQGAGHLLPDRDRHDRRDDQLAVGVLEAGAAGGADVLEHHAVDQPVVLLQVDEPVAVDPEDLADVVLGEGRPC